jgi:phthiocerol/phenolphthiocerol synthesis type-I polyketide synthase E
MITQDSPAVVGLAVLLPGAPDVAAFWDNILHGVGAHQVHGPDPGLFDPGFFRMDAQEATCLDPQHRMLLECSWHAVEAAGYDPADVPGTAALFAGCSFPSYLVQNLLPDRRLVSALGAWTLALANDRDSLTSRIAHRLDLRGPCLTVQAFSATGLVAVHLASQSLLLGECDIALAGASTMRPVGLDGTCRGVVPVSPRGICSPLQTCADGTLTGSGAVAVVLRRWGDALRDGDHVHAVLESTAVAGQGNGRAGHLGTGSAAKAEVVAEALAVADLSPGQIGYVETQATGEPVGDGLEIASLDRIFAGERRIRACRVGSVAANVGHLDAVAGLAGLVRAVLMVEHGWFPPAPEFDTPCAALETARSAFEVVTEGCPWDRDGSGIPGPRRAGIDSYGIGGCVAHAVVCEPSVPGRPGTGGQSPFGTSESPDTGGTPDGVGELFVLSARDPEGLLQLAHRTFRALSPLWDPPRPGAPSPADVAFTLRSSRGGLPCRTAFVAATRGGILRGLHRVATGTARPGELTRAPLLEPSTAVDGATPDENLARAWLDGGTLEQRAPAPGVRRVPLPGYPFDRKRYWAGPSQGEPRCEEPLPGTAHPPEHPRRRGTTPLGGRDDHGEEPQT